MIVTRPAAELSASGWWIAATLALPLLYGVYNVFASMAWPKGMSVMTAGVVESFASGLVCLPFIAVEFAVASDVARSGPLGYVLLLATLFMWVVERICFFGAIDKLGPVTAVLAVYVSTPAAVLFGFAFFARRSTCG